MMEIILELSDPVVMQLKRTMSRIFHKNFGNWKTCGQNFNKNNSNSLEENEEEENESINIELSE